MSELLRRLARWLGLGLGHEPEAPGPIVLRRVRLGELQAVAAAAALAVGGVIGVITIAGWSPAKVAAGVAGGIVAWGGLEFFTQVRDVLPGGPLPPVPDGALVEPSGEGLSLWRVALVGALCIPIAWLTDRWHLGPVFFPGQLAGYAAAHGVGLAAVARWERRHGRQVISAHKEDGGVAMLYAA